MLTKNRSKARPKGKRLARVGRFPLRPIRSDDELAEACKVIDSLTAEEDLSQEADEYLEVLSLLVHSYEQEHHPIEPLPDHELLKELMEARGLNQSQLAAATGISYATISNVMRGKREMTREQIGIVSKVFGVSPQSFSFPT